MWNVLTVDLEEWFHVCGNGEVFPPEMWKDLEPRLDIGTMKILDCLEATSSRATFFTLGWVAQERPKLVRLIHKKGHEIGCHGFYHRQIHKSNPKEFRVELASSLKVLQDLIGGPIRSFRAPEWSMRRDCKWALEILYEEGIRYDSSVLPFWLFGNAHEPTIPHLRKVDHGEILEFPPTTFWTPLGRLPLGGSLPFRLLPYSFLRKKIWNLNNRGTPVMIYLHPWEFDPGHPRVRLPPLKHLAHYTFLENTETKLRHLLEDFRFITLQEAGEKVSRS